MSDPAPPAPGWFKRIFGPAPAAEPIADPSEVDRRYRRLRLSVAITLTLTYGFAYTCRLGLSVVKEPLIAAGIYSAEELGWIGAAFLWGYGLGKVFNGLLADRVNVRRFIPVGLALSAVINLAMGSTTLVFLAAGLWALNGYCQGVGAPASVVSITQWFSHKERGTVYGIWSTAHSIGEGLTYFGTAGLVSLTVWNAAFWGPGVACLLVSVAAYFGLRGRPRSVGLPPVATWKGEAAEITPPVAGGTSGAQIELLKMPAIWILGLASASMYVTRYAINNWGVLYLQFEHDYSLMEAASFIGINTIAGIGGSAAYGYLSDRFFKARRPPLTLIFGLLEIAGLCLILLGPRHSPFYLGAGLVLYGFTLSGILAVLGGLFAVDIADKRATGAAMGIIGVFSYLGAGIQEFVSGMLIERGSSVVDGVRRIDFSTPVVFWIGASVLSAILAATLWKVRARE